MATSNCKSALSGGCCSILLELLEVAMGWREPGEKFSQSKVQRGHLYQNEPRARLNNIHESSSDKIQPTSSEVTSSQRCLDTFVIVTAHKQVCANQQNATGTNIQKSQKHLILGGPKWKSSTTHRWCAEKKSPTISGRKPTCTKTCQNRKESAIMQMEGARLIEAAEKEKKS